ncbi:MAG: hypothetical protein H6613_02370 [Ignavibacteriales bacterium]|nr:hypothetical protein [Ignavibacteriales bacterium]
MVPNHTGIYSKWIVEHPEYFIQLDYPPFPNYKFTGENLSEHHDVEVRIEDQYWAKTDAAVVFQRRNSRTGEVKYIYHGNDGTNMPWNDTAQLNLLKAEVREAVIQKIFEVARKFSVIRFDAAMTLAKNIFPDCGILNRAKAAISLLEQILLFREHSLMNYFQKNFGEKSLIESIPKCLKHFC